MAVTSLNKRTLLGMTAAASLASKQHYFMKMASTDGQVKTVAATTDIAVGVLANDPASGQAAEIINGGLAKVINGTSVGWSDGIAVGWNTTGQAVPLAANSTNDNRLYQARFVSVGQSDAPSLNQIISVEMLPVAMRL